MAFHTTRCLGFGWWLELELFASAFFFPSPSHFPPPRPQDGVRTTRTRPMWAGRSPWRSFLISAQRARGGGGGVGGRFFGVGVFRSEATRLLPKLRAGCWEPTSCAPGRL
jgi:hypothetical protein